MSKSLKDKLLGASIGLASGVLGTGLLVWRDVSVLKSDVAHIERDIDVIQRFITDDKDFQGAKDEIGMDRILKHPGRE